MSRPISIYKVGNVKLEYMGVCGGVCVCVCVWGGGGGGGGGWRGGDKGCVCGVCVWCGGGGGGVEGAR